MRESGSQCVFHVLTYRATICTVWYTYRGGGFKHFYAHPYLGKWSNLTMVTDTIIESFLALQHARVPTAAGFSIISYSLKKMGKNSSAHFAILSLDSIMPLSCILGGKPRFGLSIISWAKNGLNFL